MRKRKNRSRGWKAVRNFILLALVLFGCWAGIRSPIWMMEYELRKDAQEEFEILWEGNLIGGVYGGAMSRRPMLVANVDGNLAGCTLSVYEGHHWLREFHEKFQVIPGRPTVVTSRELADFVASYDGSLYLLAVGLPDEAAVGEITVKTREEAVYTTSGQREMDVIWFPLTITDHTWNELINAVYTLNLYNADGTLLSQTQGTLHEREEAGT